MCGPGYGWRCERTHCGWQRSRERSASYDSLRHAVDSTHSGGALLDYGYCLRRGPGGRVQIQINDEVSAIRTQVGTDRSTFSQANDLDTAGDSEWAVRQCSDFGPAVEPWISHCRIE